MKKPGRILSMIRALALSSVLALAAPGQVQAAPVIGAVAAFAATPMGAIVVNLGLSVVASFGSSLLKQLTGGADKPKANLAMRLSVAVGGIVAQSFLVGDWATAGSMNYRGSWGEDGGTPNAFYVEERVLSDLPMPELTGFWYGEQRGTILFDQPHASLGWPIEEARRDGKDHMWVKYRDGSQTVADPYLRAKFGDHDKRPYLDTMVGRGRAIAIVTRRVPGEDDRDLFPANLEYKFETSGIVLYDISKDSTAGGFGPHRWDDQSTWEPSGNTAVQIYNLWRGIRYRPSDEWLFGLQTLQPAQLPASVWIAAINEANVMKARKGKDPEPQFRTGAEISVDQELVAVTEQLLGGASGRMAEIGGIYKILLGAPGAAVYSHSDDHVVVTAEQGFDPFPQIEQTKNGVRPKYVRIKKGWELGDGPARYSSAFEAADGGRRLPADVTFATVTSPTQVQRLSKAIAEEQRRWRKHRYGLPPEASELEPLDVVSWTSPANGYVAKKFLVAAVDDEPTYLPILSTQELDPDDYDYDADAEEQPVTEGFLDLERPPVFVETAWNVEGVVVADHNGTARRPAARFTWNGLIDDVQSVAFTIRIRSGVNAGATVLTESTDRVSDGVIDFAGGRLLAGLPCEAQIKYRPRSKRRTAWSDWLPFDLPDIKLTPLDFDLDVIADEVEAKVAELDDWTRHNTREEIERFRANLVQMVDLQVIDFTARDHDKRSVSTQTGNSRAEWKQELVVATGPDSAIVQSITTLDAKVDDNQASITDALYAATGPDSAIVQSITTLDAKVDDNQASISDALYAATGPSSALALAILELNNSVFDEDTGLEATNELVVLNAAEIADINGTLTATNDSITSLTSTVGLVSASSLFRAYTQAAPSGAEARIALSVAASSGDDPTTAAIYLDAMSNGKSRIMLVADQISMTNGSATRNPFVFEDGVLTLRATRIQTIEAGLLQSSDGKSYWNLNTGAQRSST